SSRGRHTSVSRDWSSAVCSSDLGRFGQSGRVEVNWGTVPAIDGTRVQLNVSTRAAQQNQELAVAASMAGVILLGPVGLVGGLFEVGRASCGERVLVAGVAADSGA